MHLQLIEARLRNLKDKQKLPRSQFEEDETCQAAVTHWLMQAMESCFQIGTAILTLRKLPSAESYKDIFMKLFNNHLISKSLRDHLVALTGWRNLVVHGYWKIQSEELYAALQSGPGAIEEFANIASKAIMEQGTW